jgi:hypothetical protein
MGARLPTEVKKVLETFGGDKRRARAFPFE